MKPHCILLALAFAIAPLAQAQSSAAPVASVAASPVSEGEVRKVDLEAGKITLRHGPLANLDMPAMTMVFTAADPKLLAGLQQGDKVRFTAEKKDGKLVVTAIEPAK